MKNVICAKTAGFCFGVKRAVDRVYKEAENTDKPIYTFGPIIHNEQVVDDLEKKGVRIIEEKDLNLIPKESTVIIRSHGVGREIYEVMKQYQLNVVDATCPFVLKIHRIVEKESKAGKKVIIIGSKSHPEVQGIQGWVSGESLVVETKEQAEMVKIENDEQVCIVSQTTFNNNKFKELVEIIRKKGYNVKSVNTICNATEERQEEAAKIASQADCMIVIGGSSSSNTQKLYEICKKECDNTYYIQTWADLGKKYIRCETTVGITAGASTPNNIIEEVLYRVRNEF